MTPTLLRSMIRNSLKNQIKEAVKIQSGPPSSLYGFRRKLSLALKEAGAPEEFWQEVDDTGSEGGGVFGSLHDAWRNIEMELRNVTEPEERQAEWDDMLGYYVHDAVMNMVDEYKNKMNYGPGHKPEKIDASKLANDVVDVLRGQKVAPQKGSMKDLLSVLNLIRKSMKSEGATVTCSPAPNAQSKRFTCKIKTQEGHTDEAALYLDEVLTQDAGFDSSNDGNIRGASDGTEDFLLIDYDSTNIRGSLECINDDNTIVVSMSLNR